MRRERITKKNPLNAPVTFCMPLDKRTEFQTLCDERTISVSAVLRKLIATWVKDQKDKPIDE